MKNLKMLGLFVMAATALMAFAGSASAAGTFTAPAGSAYTGPWSASLEGSALLKAGFAEITCTASTVAGQITTNNSSEASGSITTVDFSSCGFSTVDTLNHNGTLKIINGTHAVSGTGVEVTVAVAGTSCVYTLGTTSKSLGNATNTGSGVTLAITTALPKKSGGFLCADPAQWTANYIVTSPGNSVID